MSNSSVPLTSPTFASSTPPTTFASSSQFVASSSAAFTPSASTAPASASSVALVTSVVTQSASNGASSAGATTVIFTSTQSAQQTSATAQSSSSTTTTSSSTTRPASLATSGANSSHGGGGLSTGGKVAIAVVVPIAAVALLILAGVYFWRKRKARKNAEEQRRKEVEEYGFNPNNDPTLPAVGASGYGEDGSEMRENDAGYRGWGATSSTQRQPSTNLSSGRGPPGVAVSDEGSNPGGYNYQGSPNEGTQPTSEAHSSEPLNENGRPLTQDSETIGALGAAPIASGRQEKDIHRGPSNASSAYSGPARSDGSEDAAGPGGAPGNAQYYDENAYYNDAQPQHGPYGDGTYGGSSQPVIRDVQARRNTRIEKPSVFPQQGNAGIAQNF